MGKTTHRQFLIIYWLISVFYLLMAIWWGRVAFFDRKPFVELESIYSQSQYVLGEKKLQIMGDGDIYTYAGIRYVQGESPTKINFEHPPLLKYLYGLSHIVLYYQAYPVILFYFISICSLYFISINLFVNSKYQLLTLIFYLLHTSIFTSLSQTMLDYGTSSLMLLTTALFLKANKHANFPNYLIMGISAGLFLSAKYPFPIGIGYLFTIAIWDFYFNKNIKYILWGFVATILTYLLSYSAYFWNNNNLFDFIKFEWWRLHWYLGKISQNKFMLLKIIFTGQYPKWWDPNGGVIVIKHWNLYWPINFLLFLSLFSQIKKIYTSPIFPLMIWSLVSFMIYLMGDAEDRFLIPLIPAFALGSTYMIKVVIDQYYSYKHLKLPI